VDGLWRREIVDVACLAAEEPRVFDALDRVAEDRT
jgi:hypothetical protein